MINLRHSGVYDYPSGLVSPRFTSARQSRLAAACRNSSARVLALYIATPRQWETHNMSPRQAELINAQLNGLQIALAGKRYSFIVP
ncbi:hypothetical protein ACLK17_03795 [Escherichia coli]